MVLTLSHFVGHIAGFCLLCYITKAELFECDGHSVMATLICTSGECCTSPLTNVIKAYVTSANNMCVLGHLHVMKDKLQGQKCVYVTFPCDAKLSYCYNEEPTTLFLTTSSSLPETTSTERIWQTENATSPVDKNVTHVHNVNTSEVNGSIDSHVIYTIRIIGNSGETARSNIQTSFSAGVIAGTSVASVFLVIICVSIFLYIRSRRKRRKQSTASPSNTLLRLENAEYADCHERSERINSTTLAPHGVSVDTTYANVNQMNVPSEKGRNSNAVPLEDSVYSDSQCAWLTENGDYDSSFQETNHVDLDKTYDHTNDTRNSDGYDSTYQKGKTFDENYDRTIQFQDRDDTYECT